MHAYYWLVAAYKALTKIAFLAIKIEFYLSHCMLYSKKKNWMAILNEFYQQLNKTLCWWNILEFSSIYFCFVYMKSWNRLYSYNFDNYNSIKNLTIMNYSNSCKKGAFEFKKSHWRIFFCSVLFLAQNKHYLLYMHFTYTYMYIQYICIMCRMFILNRLKI